MKKIKERANFSIFLPGECPAKCRFCFGKPKEQGVKFIPNLVKCLTELPITSISLTGGEPTTSPIFETVLGILKAMVPDVKVVLNTNGINLDCNIENFDVVNHINLSRHLVNDNQNSLIFNTSLACIKKEIKDICYEANRKGIDVTINTVLSKSFPSDELEEYISFAKEVGASALCFRRDCVDKTLEPTDMEKSLCHNMINRSQCPVCVTTKYLISGLSVIFKQGLMETVHNDEIFEMIFHPNGTLCEDWAGKQPISFEKETKTTTPAFPTIKYKCNCKKDVSECTPSIASNCGYRNTGSC